MLYDHVLEEGLIRYLLTRPWAATREAVGKLKPEDFDSPQRGRMFRIIQQIAVAGERVTVDAVVTGLQKGGDANAPSEVHRLMRNAKDLGGIEDVVPVLTDLSRRRRLCDPVRESLGMLEGGDVGMGLAKLRTMLAKEEATEAEEVGTTSYDVPAMLTATVEHWQAVDERPVVDLGVLRCFARELTEGQLVVVGGRSNAGKSQLAFLIGHRWAMATGGRVGFVSLEDRAHVWGDRAIANAAGFSLLSGRSANGEDAVRITRDEFQAIQRELAAMKERRAYHLEVVDTGDISDVERAMMRCLRNGCGLVVVDYVQEISDRTQRGSQRDDLVLKSIMQRIKSIGKLAQVPVIVCSQISKPTNGRAEPTGHDLNGSSAIKNMSDGLVMLWTEDDEDQHTLGKVVKLKNGPERPRFMLHRNAGGMIRDIARMPSKREAEAGQQVGSGRWHG